MSWLLAILTALAILAVAESLYSLWRGIAYNRQFLQVGEPGLSFSPPATLILPCRGVDPALSRTLRAFATQDYPDYQFIVVVESIRDPSVPLIEEFQRQYPDRSRLVTAGPASGRAQKVHNLLAAMDHLRRRDAVIAMADSDVIPHERWLADLVRPLANDQVGISSGFRWYIPSGNNEATRVRSLWNAGGASLMIPGDCPFAWGGAMAIRRQVFEDSGLREYWKGSVSDDFAAARAVRRRRLRIRFEPRCLSPSWETCSWTGLLEWTFRQLLITRVHAPRLWRLAVVAHSLSTLVFWVAVGLVAVALVEGAFPAGSGGFLAGALAAYLLGALKSGLRLRAVGRVIENPAGSILAKLTHVMGGPVASLVSLIALMRSALTREMTWRGIRYRLVSADVTEILAVEPVRPPREEGDSLV